MPIYHVLLSCVCAHWAWEFFMYFALYFDYPMQGVGVAMMQWKRLQSIAALGQV